LTQFIARAKGSRAHERQACIPFTRMASMCFSS